jgi:hypothetical protein
MRFIVWSTALLLAWIVALAILVAQPFVWAWERIKRA